MSRPATRAQLYELHRCLVVNLLECMNPKAGRRPGQELLAVVGQLLKQEGIKGFLVSERRAAQMRELYRLYTMALLRHLESGAVSAGVLAEIGAHLRASGVTKDLGAVEAVQSMQKLADQSLPFND